MSTDKWRSILDEISDNMESLTEWETTFIESQMERIENGFELALSDKQKAIIQRIYEERILNW